MAEFLPLAGTAIQAGTSLIGGLMGSDAQRKAAGMVNRATQAGQDIIGKTGFAALDFLRPQRESNINALNRLQTASESDWYNTDRPNYLTGLQPFIDEQTGLATRAGELATYGSNVANYFDPTKTTGGLPDWWSRATDNFKFSPDYRFAHDEAMRAGLQAGPATGGRMMGLQDRAAGLASQNYGTYAQNAMKSILGGATSGMEGIASALKSLGISSDIFGRAAEETSGAIGGERSAYNEYFNRLLGVAGLTKEAPAQSASVAMRGAEDYAGLGVGGAKALGAGEIGATNAMTTGLTGAGAAIAPLFSKTNPNNILGMFGQGTQSSYAGANLGSYNPNAPVTVSNPSSTYSTLFG